MCSNIFYFLLSDWSLSLEHFLNFFSKYHSYILDFEIFFGDDAFIGCSDLKLIPLLFKFYFYSSLGKCNEHLLSVTGSFNAIDLHEKQEKFKEVTYMLTLKYTLQIDYFLLFQSFKI